MPSKPNLSEIFILIHKAADIVQNLGTLLQLQRGRKEIRDNVEYGQMSGQPMETAFWHVSNTNLLSQHFPIKKNRRQNPYVVI